MDSPKIFTGTMKDQIYNILRQRILDGALNPGDKIIEQQIADELGVSRSPVREAAKQLTGDGLLTYVPEQGRVRAATF